MIGALHELIFGLLPPMGYIAVGPAEVLIAVGGTGWLVFELRAWRRHR